MRLRPPYAVLLILLATAGEAQTPSRRATAMRDSSGVPIVTVSPRALSQEISVAQTGRFRGGGLTENLEEELRHNNGYLGGVSTSRGWFASIDLDRVRFFDSTGRHIRSTGRTGAGPGEMSMLTEVCRTRGDTVVAFDNTNRRLNVLSQDGTLVRQIDARTRGFLTPFGCFEDGTFILSRTSEAANVRELFRYRLDGSEVGLLGVVPIRPAWTSASVAVARRTYFVADPQASEVREFDINGRLLRIFRFSESAQPMSAQEVSGMGLQPRAGAPRSTAPTSSSSAMVRPLFRRVLVSPSGTLWLSSFRSSVRDEDSWFGVSPSGADAGRIVIRFDSTSMARPPMIAEIGDTSLTWLRFPLPDGAAVFETVPLRAATQRVR